MHIILIRSPASVLPSLASANAQKEGVSIIWNPAQIRILIHTFRFSHA